LPIRLNRRFALPTARIVKTGGIECGNVAPMTMRTKSLREITPLLIGVQSNPERDVSLARLAAEYGYSPSHFHRVFTNTVGETPKAHVERMRLERAAYRLAVTKEGILDIALSIGFRSHETFTRAFRRRFDCTPSDLRRQSVNGQKAWLKANRVRRPDGSTLSNVSYLTLKPMTLLAMRRMGKYGTFGTPDWEGGPSDWSPLIDELRKRKLPFRKLGMMFCYDNPRLTPPQLQSMDACVPLLRAAGAPRKGTVRRLDFAGGLYGVIEHRGPVATLENAYGTLAMSIVNSGRFALKAGPPLEILREIGIDGDPDRNLNEIYLPVETIR
jgi:AraC family transcriptional regulator